MVEDRDELDSRETQRRPSGWRNVLFGLLTFIVVAAIFFSGMLAGGASFLLDGIKNLFDPTGGQETQILTGDAVVQQIRQISRLETTTYTIERVIDVRQSDDFWPDWLRGDRLLLIAHGVVVAGIDLEKLTPEQVNVSPDGKSITVDLPPVEIFNLGNILNTDRTRVYDRQQGLFAPPHTDLETRARQSAEGEILAAACEEGIMERATEDARRAMEKLLGVFEAQVTVRAAGVPPCPAPGL